MSAPTRLQGGTFLMAFCLALASLGPLAHASPRPARLFTPQTSVFATPSATSVLSTSAPPLCQQKRKKGRRPKLRPKPRPKPIVLPLRYRVPWGRECRRFPLPEARCRNVWKRKQPAEVLQLLETMLALWKERLDATTPAEMKTLAAKRQKYFPVDRCWWDRRQTDPLLQLIDGLDRLLQPILPRLSPEEYQRFLFQAAPFLEHPAIPLPQQSTLLSRLSRWLFRRPHPQATKRIVSFLKRDMLQRKECPWWYIIFLGNFDGPALEAFADRLEPGWCSWKKFYQTIQYRSPADIEREMAAWTARYPRYARLHRFGKSAEGLPLVAIQIGPKRPGPEVKSVLFVGNQHGDEHVGSELLMDLIRRILEPERHEKKKSSHWRQTLDIWIIPTLNPDGKRFDLLGGVVKYWRFNRRIHEDGQSGVDLNRNWSYQWKEFSFHGRGRLNLPGPAAFSEPETEALRRLIVAKMPRLSALLDVHQFGRVVLMPYAWTRTLMPPPWQALFTQIGAYLTKDNRYRSFPAHRLYPHQGTLGDWGFGEYKALSLVLELGYNLYLNPTQVKAVIKENQTLLERFLDLAPDPFRRIQEIAAEPL